MRVEVRCAGCGKGYLVDESLLRAGHIPCPACGGVMGENAAEAQLEAGVDEAMSSLFGPDDGAAERPPDTDQPASPPPTTPPTAEAPKPEPEPRAPEVRQPPVAAAPEQVVCPRCQLHFTPRTAEAAAAARKDRQTVLIVEDMSYFREIAADALAESYEVKTAGTVDGARSILEHGGIDLLILDLTLDGGDHGLDLLREMKFKACPILIYTAQDESEMYGDSWDELMALGADDIVIKGMNVGESLQRKVAGLLGVSADGDD